MKLKNSSKPKCQALVQKTDKECSCVGPAPRAVRGAPSAPYSKNSFFRKNFEVLTEKLFPIILARLGVENPSKRRCRCIAQVRCDIVSFGTISICYVQLVKKKKCIHAGQPWVLSSMCTHSGTICLNLYGSLVRRQVLRDVTRHFNRPFGNLPGFEYRRVIHRKTIQ